MSIVSLKPDTRKLIEHTICILRVYSSLLNNQINGVFAEYVCDCFSIANKRIIAS